MRPLEIAAKAYNLERERWRIHEQLPPKSRYYITCLGYESGVHVVVFETDDHGEIHLQFERLRDGAAMRTALLALAESDLSDDLIDGESKGMIWGTSGSLIDMNRNNFRAMLKAIASEADNE